MHIIVYTPTYFKWIQTHIHTRSYKLTSMRLQTYTPKYMHGCTNAQTYIDIHTQVYTFSCRYIHIYIHNVAYIHTQILRHTHAYIQIGSSTTLYIVFSKLDKFFF